MIRFKKGSTFELDVEVTDNKAQVNISAWTIRSQIRKSGILVDELVPVNVDFVHGKYKLTESASGVSSTWEAGTHDCDIKYTVASKVFHTETFPIEILENVTHEEPPVTP